MCSTERGVYLRLFFEGWGGLGERRGVLRPLAFGGKRGKIDGVAFWEIGRAIERLLVFESTRGRFCTLSCLRERKRGR